MNANLEAKSSITVAAPGKDVWAALMDPAAIEQYMFGAQVTTDWREGSSITWRGEWQGRPFEDKGVIVTVEPEELLRYSHTSGTGSAQQTHTVSIYLASDGVHTRVDLTQDGNLSELERAHAQKNWDMMLAKLKDYVEERASRRTSNATA